MRTGVSRPYFIFAHENNFVRVFKFKTRLNQCKAARLLFGGNKITTQNAINSEHMK